MSPLRTLGVKLAEYALTGLLLIVGCSVVLGYVFDAPVLLTFVETGSMEPTIAAGDGFIAVPPPITTVGQGDVVSFRPDVIEGGRVTTHRIVGETPNGYITQGDANFVTDQDGGEPPVTEGQIVAVAFSVNGRIVTLPHVGTAVGALSDGVDRGQRGLSGALGLSSLQGSTGLAYVLFAFGAAVYLAMLAFGTDDGRTTSRATSRSTGVPGWVIIAVAAGVVMTAASVGMVAPAGTQTYGIVSGSGESSASHVIQQGTSEERQYPVGNGAVLPVVVYLDPASDGVTTPEESYALARGETANLTMTLSAPDETGYYIRSVREYRYPMVLPKVALDGLYAIHPTLPFVVINALAGGTVVIVGLAFGGQSTRIRSMTRRSHRS